jgi:hypothetical protein
MRSSNGMRSTNQENLELLMLVLTAIPHNFYEYFPPNICENAPDS